MEPYHPTFYSVGSTLFILVKALVRVHYGKYWMRGVSIGPIQYEAKPSAVLALETCPKCNVSLSAQA